MYTGPDGMGLTEQISMLTNIREEMKQLQFRLDYIAPKAEAYAVVCQILGLVGGRSLVGEQRNAERLIDTMDKRLDILEKQREENNAKMKASSQSNQMIHEQSSTLANVDLSMFNSHEKALLLILDNMQLTYKQKMEFIGLLRAIRRQKDRMPEAGSGEDSPAKSPE